MLRVEQVPAAGECRCVECRAIEQAIAELVVRAHQRRVAHAEAGRR